MIRRSGYVVPFGDRPMSIKTSTVASSCPQCGCAVFPCPSCGQLMKDGAVLCVSCGYHLQLAKHVGGSANGSNGVTKAALPHANGHDAKGHAHVVAAGNTQDYIASLLGGHGPSHGSLPAETQPTGVVHGANTHFGNGYA